MIGIFGTALLISLPGLLRNPQPSTTTLLWGALLGAANMLATYFWIRTLAVLPGSIAYPTLGVGVIAVGTLAGLVIWKEKLRPANVLFLILASLSILLINI
jgi:multidrug transporter EmrE-like cation transporter